MDSLIDRSLNRYKIIELLGKGGIGAVYKARDGLLQRIVAIKVMDPELASQPNFRNRFLQEARIAARLDHPNIVQVHDFGEAENYLYIVMEYIPGNNMRQMLQSLRSQKQWVVLNEAVRIVIEVARALEYVHKQGVTHRDIKPDNLMLKPEPSDDLPYRVIITDLGLAQLENTIEGEEGHSSMGTPAYMSPEQALGQPTDARSDVYSLGVLLYELTVGKLPFAAKTIAEARHYHASVPVPQPRSIHPELPEQLEQVILKALEKDPARRYANTAEMAAALETAMPAVEEEVSNPTEVEDTVSLVTQYDLTPAEEFVPPTIFRNNQQNFIEILFPDQTIHRVAIKPGGDTIGRDPSNDIVLEGPKVSRRHGRVEYDGKQYWISDLNSKNGTYLAGKRLVPGTPEAWKPDQTVRIGDFYLNLKLSGALPPDLQETLPPKNLEAPNPTLLAAPPNRPAGGNTVGIFMETLQLSVIPGNAVTANLIVMNRGQTVDHLRVSIQGIPANWIPSPPPVLQLAPGGQQEVRLIIQPPQSPQTKPGRYPLNIRVYSTDNAERNGQVDALMNVGVFTRFAAELRPRQISDDHTAVVSVQNQGNARESFTVSPVDTFDELAFDPPDAHLSLAEGEAAAVEFRASSRRRRLFGGARTLPFNANVAPSNGIGKTLTGEVLTSGVFPPILLPLLLLLCLCLAAGAAYGYINVLGGPAGLRETQNAATQAAAGTQGALVFARTATVGAATQQAATATALAAASIVPTATDTPTPTVTPTATGAPSITPTPTQTTTPAATPTPTNPPPTQTPVIIIITPTQAPTAVQPTPTPRGGNQFIEFSSSRNGQTQIYAMPFDGSQQIRLTDLPGNNEQPALSPDRTRTLFVNNQNSHFQIFIMDSNGQNIANLSNNNSNDTSPAWSPDGKRIAFASTRDGNRQIYVMNADGSGVTRLTNNKVDDDHPVWSPDGSRIVYDEKASEGDQRMIMIMNADGSGQANISHNGAVNYEPSFAPDGSRIVYVSNKDGNYDLWLMNPDGSGQTRLTNLGTTAYNPHFSKDGDWIIFESQAGGSGDIYVVNKAGNQLFNLTNNPADDAQPTW